mgnify:CR=1 FL=1
MTSTIEARQTAPEPLLDPARTYELDRQHVFHSWSAQAKITPMTVVSADGSRRAPAISSIKRYRSAANSSESSLMSSSSSKSSTASTWAESERRRLRQCSNLRERWPLAADTAARR